MPLYEPSHLHELTSWVHDLHRCVTTRSAALELGLTRRAAAALLTDLIVGGGDAQAQGSGETKYEVHYSRVVRDDNAAEGSCNTCEFDLVRLFVYISILVNWCRFSFGGIVPLGQFAKRKWQKPAHVVVPGKLELFEYLVRCLLPNAGKPEQHTITRRSGANTKIYGRVPIDHICKL